MFGTMEDNATPYRAVTFGEESVGQNEADLLRALQTASENIMRLAGKLRAEHRAEDAASIYEQNALAQELIGRLLEMPATR